MIKGDFMKRFIQRAMINPLATTTSGGDTPSGGDDWIGDGNTHIWISLAEGRTSPMLGVCPKGTVTVDWGDGSAPDTLTGASTSTVKYTPNHEYGKAGDYVITLTVEGEMGLYGVMASNQHSTILRYSDSADTRNIVYQNAVQRVEIGEGVTSITVYGFGSCYSLESVIIPNSITSIDNYTFYNCFSLKSVIIPNSVTSTGTNVFYNCRSLTSVDSLGRVTSIGDNTFRECFSLKSVNIPNGVTSIGKYAFQECKSLTSIVIPNSVTSIETNAFYYCFGVRYYDFTACVKVPTLSSTNVFGGISADCEIRVPAALVDEWKAATNWSTYEANIVGV